MIHLTLNDEAGARPRRLPFFLAMEEWAAAQLPADEYFFTWSVEPTVIIGRNQDLETEVDREYCAARGIEIVRRRSGGGCVYADRDNLMLSYVSPRIDVLGTFADYTARVCKALAALGIDAVVSGRNDITVGGKKVSGTAFYHLPGRSIVHGTMLYDTDFENMMKAITPSRAKLESNMVKSVESRITTLRSLLPGLTLEELNTALIRNITDSSLVLDNRAVSEIEQIEQRYYRHEWIERRQTSPTVRIKGVGDIALTPRCNEDGSIDSFEIGGDAFVLKDTSELVNRVRGAKKDADALARRLEETDVSDFIAGLTNATFIDLLLKPKETETIS
ncbi:MAG: lipoyltransferase [Muribaculaceae bacterium]|nr:lipoyltransferase [Muribaculaceae bacterium]